MVDLLNRPVSLEDALWSRLLQMEMQLCQLTCNISFFLFLLSIQNCKISGRPEKIVCESRTKVICYHLKWVGMMEITF